MLDTIVPLFINRPLASFVVAIVVFVCTYTGYLFHRHTLWHIPGPLVRRVTAIPLLYSSFAGTEATSNARLHAKYGPIVLTGPTDVDIADGAAISPIYVEKGGFRKADFYKNFDIGGHATLFSELDNGKRAPHAKGVSSMFAMGRIRQASTAGNTVDQCVEDFVAALKKAKAARSSAVDLLDLSRQLTMDVLTSFLYGQRWSFFNGTQISSTNTKSSVSLYVQSVIAIGGLFKFPKMFTNSVAGIWLSIQPRAEETKEATGKIESFVREAVASAEKGNKDTFQKRLLGTGASQGETAAVMKDVIFAGTDTPSTVISKLLWNLTQQPDLQLALREELNETSGVSMPLLHATVREALRTSMANPTPLSRVVPPQGWTYTAPAGENEKFSRFTANKTYNLPAGTTVGIQMYSVHLNAATYPDPLAFEPYRWMPPTQQSSHSSKGDDVSGREGNADTKTMHRDFFAFGAGTRQCIGQNLAMEEITLVLRRVVQEHLLEGATVVHKELPIREWFNSQLVDNQGVFISFAET